LLSATGFFANPLAGLAGGSATGASDEENTGPKLQLSLAVQFSERSMALIMLGFLDNQ